MKNFAITAVLIMSFTASATAQEMTKEPVLVDETAEELINKKTEPTLTPTAITTIEDAKAFAEMEFLRADVDSDGQVSIDEFTSYLSITNATAIPAISSTKASGSEIHISTQTNITHTPHSPEEAFAKISANDEIITKDEMIASREQSFEKADEDGDALLDDQEKETFAALVSAHKQS